MADSSVVRSNANSSGSGIAAASWEITLPDSAAGNQLYLAIEFRLNNPLGSVAVTDDHGNTWFIGFGGGLGVNALNFAECVNVLDGVIHVIVVATGSTIDAISTVLIEVTGTDLTTPASEFGNQNGFNGGIQNVTLPAGSGLTAACQGENAIWTPDTLYDSTGTNGYSQVQDTNTPTPGYQLSIIDGTSDSAAPAWNEAGGTTPDGTVTWLNFGAAPTGSFLFAVFGYQPFSEFLAPDESLFQLIAQTSGFLGLSVYAYVGPWVGVATSTVSKTTDTYELSSLLTMYAGSYTPPAPPASGDYNPHVNTNGLPWRRLPFCVECNSNIEVNGKCLYQFP